MKVHTTRGAAMLAGPGFALLDMAAKIALTHARPYKQAWTVADSVREITCQSGRQFDPEIVAAFLSVLPEPGEAIERRTRFSSPVLTA